MSRKWLIESLLFWSSRKGCGQKEPRSTTCTLGLAQPQALPDTTRERGRRVAIYAVSAFCIFLTAAVCLGAEPIKLVGPEKAEVGAAFDVSVENLTLDLAAAPPQMNWYSRCGKVTLRQRYEAQIVVVDGKPVWKVTPYATVTGLEPAKIAVELLVVRNGVAELAALEVQVGPFDPVPPPPPPPPVPGKRHLIFVEETQQRSPQLAAVVLSQKLRDYCKTRECGFWDLDKDAQAGTAASWAARAAGKLPMLFIADEKGTIVWSGPPPATPDATIALLQANGG